MVDLNTKNLSVSDIKPPTRNKKLFFTSVPKKSSVEKKTLRDLMFDTESGVPMRINDDFTDQIDISNKLFTETPHTSMIENRRSRKSSSNVNIIEQAKRDFLSQKRENEESQMSKRSVKPQIIIENGVIRLERPNYIEVKKKVSEDIRIGNERNAVSIDMTHEKAKLTSMSFRKKNHTEKWSEEETEFFYKALEFFGTDFSLLEIILKPRNRNQIKNKFHKEERINKEKVENSLKNFTPDNVVKFFSLIKDLKKKKRKYDDIDFKKLILNNFVWSDEFFLKKNEDNISENDEEEEPEEEEDPEDNDDNLTISDNV
jgi:hypothetical protein